MTNYEWLKQQIEKQKREPTQACIEWPYSARWTGHGQVVEYCGRQNGRSIQKAHRVHSLAFEWYYGHKPKRNVLHTCDNPACYNPAHLYEGSQKQNMADKEQRGDPNHTGPKLTEEKASEIYRLSHSGITQKEIAERFGVSIPTVSAIKNGRTWRNLATPGASRRKLTESEVGEIVELLDLGLTHADIAERFEIERSTVSHINTGRNWNHITHRSHHLPRPEEKE